MKKTVNMSCPGCGHHLNGVQQVGGDGQPGPGDISACLYCGLALVFVNGSEVRLMTEQEKEKLSADERYLLSSAMAVGAIFRAKYGNGEKA